MLAIVFLAVLTAAAYKVSCLDRSPAVAAAAVSLAATAFVVVIICGGLVMTPVAIGAGVLLGVASRWDGWPRWAYAVPGWLLALAPTVLWFLL